MATPYSTIDDMFLSDINDDTFLTFEESIREEILNSLRKKATTRFKACRINLYDKDDTLKQFNQTLSDDEQLIIATIMRKFWLNDKINNLDLLRQKFTTKDWKLTSQANHLDKLLVLKKDLEEEISKMIVDYTLYKSED